MESMEKTTKRKFNGWRILEWCAFIALFIWLLLNILGIRVATVDGSSMYPNLVNNEKVTTYHPIWWKFDHHEYQRGQVIIFKANTVDPRYMSNNNIKDSNLPVYYTKRIIAVPGDTVEFNNNVLYVNGKPVDQSFISHKQATLGTYGPLSNNGSPRAERWTLESLADNNTNPIAQWNQYSIKDLKDNKVPNGMYFVMGDNRAISNDSRYYGFVKDKDIQGVVHATTHDKHKINDIHY